MEAGACRALAFDSSPGGGTEQGNMRLVFVTEQKRRSQEAMGKGEMASSLLAYHWLNLEERVCQGLGSRETFLRVGHQQTTNLEMINEAHKQSGDEQRSGRSLV